MDSLGSEVLFFVFAAVVVLPFIPLSWSLLAYLLCLHIAPPSAGYESALSFGLRNAAAAVLLPTILLARTRFRVLPLVASNPVLRLWIVFLAYVAIAVLWTPYRIPAFKQLGYLYGYIALLLLFTDAYLDPKLNLPRIIAASIVIALSLAVLQTFVMGNVYGGHAGRLSSFGPPQAFGLYLAISFGLLGAFVRGGSLRVRHGVALMTAVVAALVLNGSRQGMIAVILTVVFLMLPIRRRPLAAIFLPVILVNMLLVGMAASRYMRPSAESATLGSHRALEVSQFFTEGLGAVQNIGTSRARFEIYETVLDLVGEKGPLAIAFGSGTSSAADLIVNGWIRYRDADRYTVDSNRVVHNEILRALYEWGILGASLLSAALLALLVASARFAVGSAGAEAWVLAFLISLIVGVFFLLGNILAASSTPLGAAVVLPVAALFSTSIRERLRRDRAVLPGGGRRPPRPLSSTTPLSGDSPSRRSATGASLTESLSAANAPQSNAGVR